MSADPLRQEQEPTMGMLSEAFGSAVAGVRNRIGRVGMSRRGDWGSGPSSIGRHVGRAFVVGLVGTGVVLMASDAANAKSRGSSKASAAPAPAFDAQAINAAQFPAPSGKGRAPAPSAAAIMKAEILLDRAGSRPVRSTARSTLLRKRPSRRFRMPTESSRPAVSTRKPGSA